MAGIIPRIGDLNNSDDFKALLSVENASKLALSKSGNLTKSNSGIFSRKKRDREVNLRVRNIVKVCISTIEKWKEENGDLKLTDRELEVRRGYSKEQIKEIRQFEKNVKEIFEKKLTPLVKNDVELQVLLNNAKLRDFLDTGFSNGIIPQIDLLNKNADFKALLNSDPSRLTLSKGNLAKSNFWGFSSAKSKKEVNARVAYIVKVSVQAIEGWQRENRDKILTDQELEDKGYSREQVKQIRQFENDMQELFEEKLKPFVKNNPKLRSLLANKELHNFLNPKLKELRQQKNLLKEELGEDSDLSEDSSFELPKLTGEEESQKLTRQIEKAKLAAKFGLVTNVGKGKTGAHFVEWVSKDGKGEFKKIGIFKLSNKETSLSIRIKNKFKQLFFGQLYYLNTKKLAQSKSEAAAFEVSKFLDFPISPGARVVKLGDKTGTMQRFLNGYQEAEQVSYLLQNQDNFTPQGWKQFQQMTLFDYLIGNLDRHHENWLVKLDEEGKVNDIKAIDNVNSFPEKNIFGIKVAARNQYKWRNFQISGYAYDSELLNDLRSHLTPIQVGQMISSINDRLPGFLSDKMETLLKERAQALYLLADPERGPFTPQELAEYRTHSSIKALLKSAKSERK
ncbi:hypothetical protein [Parachlamydia acanthamoebae]|uniref:hypothetical protein n=1 Tax=Parachlamydia acanthamoebae TaxID=83552 RepID=UPI0007519823|nr:hypothetical protein [Parachlamydia acanthamoebae]